MRLIWFSLTMLVFINTSVAQSLVEDRDFFNQQSRFYDLWLESEGLSQYLSLREIEVLPDQLTIYLEFPYQDLDSIRNVWDLLKTEYEANTILRLEDQLFFKCISIMNVIESDCVVKILDTYDKARPVVFGRVIYFEKGEVRILEQNPRDERRSFSVKVDHLAPSNRQAETKILNRFTKDNIFELIEYFAQQRYQMIKCAGRKPAMQKRPSRDYLRFEVSNLCREVITDAVNPMACRIINFFGGNCQAYPREKLIFHIQYEPIKEGFRIIVLIDGLVANGWIKEVDSRRAYFPMVAEFDPYIKDYADNFIFELEEYIRNNR